MEQNEQPETDVQEAEIHPEIEKILNYVIPHRKVRSDLLTSEEGLRVRDLIDGKTDIRFDNHTGKPMMVHSGILSIWDGIGAEFLEPKLEKTGHAEYQVVQGVRFADGTVFYSTGEASQQNTDDRELSGKFPVNQAHIRAVNKALIRGLGLYRVLLTEEESDAFTVTQANRIQQQYEEALIRAKTQAQDKERRLLMLIEGMMELIALPESDQKYPNQYITDIAEDRTYLEELKIGEDKIVGFVANQFLKKRALNTNIQEESDRSGAEYTTEEQPPLDNSQEPEAPFEETVDTEEPITTNSDSPFEDEREVQSSEGEVGELKVASQDDNWVADGEEELSAPSVTDSISNSEEPTEGNEDSDIKHLEEFFGEITAQIEMDEQSKSAVDSSTEVFGGNVFEEDLSNEDDIVKKAFGEDFEEGQQDGGEPSE